MIDPETARQAWAEAARRWCSVSDRTTLVVIDGAALLYAGQALAVLVPQLLDQLAEKDADNEQLQERLDHPEYSARLLNALAAEPTVMEQRDQMETERDITQQTLDEVGSALSALGERCHQLETALAQVVKAWTVEGISPPVHRAAKDKLRREWPTLHHAVSHAARAALGDTAAPPEPVQYCETHDETFDPWSVESRRHRGGNCVVTTQDVVRGDAAVSPEPPSGYDAFTAFGGGGLRPPSLTPNLDASWVDSDGDTLTYIDGTLHRWDNNRWAAVEPPQPSEGT